MATLLRFEVDAVTGSISVQESIDGEIHRRVILPGDSLAGEDSRLQAVSAAAVTQAMIDAATAGQAAPAAVPYSVSRFQALAALEQAGMLAQVEALMADANTDPIARLAWQNAAKFHRDSPTLRTLAIALALSDAQLDQLFVSAASITA